MLQRELTLSVSIQSVYYGKIPIQIVQETIVKIAWYGACRDMEVHRSCQSFNCTRYTCENC